MTARFTPSEHAALEALAAASGCSIAQLVRAAALKATAKGKRKHVEPA